MSEVVKVFGRKKALELRKYFKAVTGGAFGSDKLRKVFQKEVFRPYGAILLRNGKDSAGKISRSGLLARSLKITGGKSGRGGIGLAVRGPAAKYAMIINNGGWIYPKNHKYLTIPVGDNIDPKTGEKVKTMWQFPDDRTFTITPKSGRMAGRRFVFLKSFSTSNSYPPRRRTRSSDGKLRRKQPSVKAIFELKEKHYVKPTNWANIAYNKSIKELNKLVKATARKYYSPNGYKRFK